jgi:CRP-like cAMP-binding protein
MLTNLIDQLAQEMLLHVAFLTVAVAFLVRDVLWLRGLSIVAYSLFMAVAAVARPEAPWTLLAWYGGFIGINVAHAAWLICERQMCRLSEAEKGLRALAFPALDHLTLRRLLRQGTWLDLPAGACLTRRGEKPQYLYVVYDGHVDVHRDGRDVAAIGSGHFVGEIAFVTDSPASADTYAGTTVRAVAWDQTALNRVCQRQPQLREALYSAIGPDLARKITHTSARLSASDEPLDLMVAPGATHAGADRAFERSADGSPNGQPVQGKMLKG